MLSFIHQHLLSTYIVCEALKKPKETERHKRKDTLCWPSKRGKSSLRDRYVNNYSYCHLLVLEEMHTPAVGEWEETPMLKK